MVTGETYKNYVKQKEFLVKSDLYHYLRNNRSLITIEDRVKWVLGIAAGFKKKKKRLQASNL